MAKHKHYSPALSRLNVCALYHEAKQKRIPMTKFADEIVSKALAGSYGMQKASEAMQLQEK